jgi:multiple sugar transport system permease protein
MARALPTNSSASPCRCRRPCCSSRLILRLIDSFKQYDLFFALTGGGPGDSTMTVSFAVAKTAFSYFYTGEASALAVVLLFIIIGLSMILVRHLGKMGEKILTWPRSN